MVQVGKDHLTEIKAMVARLIMNDKGHPLLQGMDLPKQEGKEPAVEQ